MANEYRAAVECGNLDCLQKLLGTFDENLNLVTDELKVYAEVSGTKIVVTGEENRVRIAETVLQKLCDIILAGESVDKTRIIYCIELAREGNADNVVLFNAEEIFTRAHMSKFAEGNNGIAGHKCIRAST